MKKSRDVNESVQTAVRLPRHVLDRLKESDLGVSGEIRRRLDRTFDLDAFDDRTRDLADCVMWIASEVSRQVGHPWHVTGKGQQAVAAAIQYLLEPAEGSQIASTASEDLFGPDDPPTLGRSIARHYQRHIAEMRNALRLLKGETS